MSESAPRPTPHPDTARSIPDPAPFDGTRFHDPEGQPADKSLLDVAKWMLGTKKVAWPKRRDPEPHTPVSETIDGMGLRATFVGHATVLLQVAGLNLLTDPFWSDRASPVSFAGPKRAVPPGLPFDALPPIDAVLLSHNHYDHLDALTLARLARTHAPSFVAPLRNRPYVAPHIGSAPYAELDWGEGVDLGAARITALRTRHWSRRKAGDMNRALWSAYAIETPAGAIYFAGDTAHRGGRHFDEAAAFAGPYRLALLPIGAYEPRTFMRDQHMNPEEAVDGFRRCHAAHALAIHHATIQLTNEGIDEPAERLGVALRNAGIAPGRFRAPPPGSSWDVPPGPA